MFINSEIDLRLKPPNVGIQVLWTESEGMATKHTLSIERCCGHVTNLLNYRLFLNHGVGFKVL